MTDEEGDVEIDLTQQAADAGADIVDVTTQSFMQDVIEASKSQLVLLDLWAPWCGPCKQLTPVLEKVVRASKGAVRLAKMNIDEEPAVAQQLQVQSIPAVFAFKNGQPVDGFMGALPESQVMQFVERHLGDQVGQAPEDEVRDAAEAAFAAQDFAQAAQLYGQLLQFNADDRGALAGLAQCFLATGQTEQAEQILLTVPELERDREPIAAALATLALRKQAGEASGDIAALEAQLAEKPDDHQARYDLAMAYQAIGQKEAAVAALLEIISRKRDWNEDAARQQLLTLFQSYGFDDPVAIEGRKQLSSLLFA